VDCVASHYFEGRADRQRIRAVVMPSGEVLMAPTEEIVIDRIGQWIASDLKDPDLHAQIVGLLSLAEELDEPYVLGRVKEEAGVEVDLAAFRPTPQG
jgi:hypothetical protein